MTSNLLLGTDTTHTRPDEMATIQTATRRSNGMTILKTVIFLCTYFQIGIVCALTGTTYVHLELLLNCDTKIIAIILPLGALGVVFGSFLSMSNVNRLNYELTFAVALVVQSASTMLMLAVPSIYWVLGMSLLQGCGVAITSGELQIYILQLYKNHRLKDPMLQASHALWSLGVAIGPLFVAPFLVELSAILHQHDPSPTGQNLSTAAAAFSDSIVESTDVVDSTFPSISAALNVTDEHSYFNNSSSVDLAGVALVRYAYVALGSLLLIPTVGFVVVHFQSGASLRRPTPPEKPASSSSSEKPASSSSAADKRPAGVVATSSSTRRKSVHRTTFAVLSLVFYYFYVYVEVIPRGFLTTFVVKLLAWSTRDGTLINSAFFGAVCFGRVTGVPISAWLRPRTVLAVNLAISLSASVLFLFAERHAVVVWLAAALLGYGISTTYGAMQLWMEANVDLGPRLMALIVIVTASGGLTGPPIVGQLFDHVTAMWVVYALLIAVAMTCVMFAVMVLIERLLKRRRPRSYVASNLEMANGGANEKSADELKRLRVAGADEENPKVLQNGHEDVHVALSA